jgi:tetratricopeptide (TPR) repeat protein
LKKVGLGVVVILSVAAAVLVWRGVLPTSILGLSIPVVAWPTSWPWLDNATIRRIAILLVTLVLGSTGLLAVTYKFFLSEGRARFDARRKFTETVTADISGLAKSHYWALANYSGTLAAQFESYIDAQNQLLLLRWDRRRRLQSELHTRADQCADASFWTFCQLLLRFDDFQFRGSNTYLLTTHAAGELAKKLYNSFIAALPRESETTIDTLTILKTLRHPPPPAVVIATATGEERRVPPASREADRIADLPARAFIDGVDTGAIDLKEVRRAYTAWLRDQPLTVEKAGQSLRAYSELLTHELALLHEQWFLRRKGLWSTEWPRNAISSNSLQTMQQVRFESALLASMPTRDEPRTQRDLDPRQKKPDPPRVVNPWEGDSYSESKEEPQPGEQPAPERNLTARTRDTARSVWKGLQPARSFTALAFMSLREALPIREHVWRQARGIQAAQVSEIYRVAIQTYVTEHDVPTRRSAKLETSLTHVLSYLRKRTLLELRQASIANALLSYSAHDRGDSIAAHRHLHAALRHAKRAYRRVNRMNELSVDRRYLSFFGSAVAILYHERGLLLAEAGRFRSAKRSLAQAQLMELDWDVPLVDSLGTLNQLKAGAVANADSGLALKLLEESYRELRTHGATRATRMAGRSRFQAAQLLRSTGNADGALAALKDSYQCYREPPDPLSLATILEEFAALHVDGGNFELALRALDDAIEQTKGDVEELQKIRGRCLARRSVLKLGLGQYREAREEITESLALFRAQGWKMDPWSRFVDVTRSLLDDATRRARVQRLMGQVARAEANVGERAFIVDRVKSLLTEVGAKTPNPNGSDDRLGVDVPLTVAINSATLPDDWRVPKSIELFRERTAAAFGVKVPGIRYRFDESLDETRYEIGIMTVREQWSHGQPQKNPVPDVDPAPFGPFWEPTRKLFDTIENRLDEFVGNQEMLNLLDSEFGAEMKGDPAAFQTHAYVSAMTTVAQSLLAEGLPITELRRIRKRVLEGLDSGDSLQDIVESLRAAPEIRDGVPAWARVSTLLELGPTFESELSDHVRTAGAFTVLVSSGDSQRRWIEAIEEVAVPAMAVVLRDERLRPLIREVIRRGLPETQVLAYPQLGGNAPARLSGVLEAP